MKDTLRPACVLFVLLTLLTGVLYPVLVTLVAQTVFRHQANGSIVLQAGKPIGSELIGQAFDSPEYFWGRPSATGPTPYNASASSGSNLGPTNPAHLDAVRTRIEAIRKSHPGQSGAIPVDFVTTSGSGLDPHISQATAEYQISRVAKARRMSEAEVRRLVTERSEGRTLGVLGEKRVNVLLLNWDLDARERSQP